MNIDTVKLRVNKRYVVISSFNVSLVSHGDTMSDDVITHVKLVYLHVYDIYTYMHVHA